MLRNSIKPITVFCFAALVAGCANFDERRNNAAPVAAVAAGTGPATVQNRSAPRERVVIRDGVIVRERPYRSFDREIEERYEQEEEFGGRQRQRHD
jgi:hypothetical protein